MGLIEAIGPRALDREFYDVMKERALGGDQDAERAYGRGKKVYR